jgi:hypothetical protein
MIVENERFAGVLRVLGSGATRRGALGVLAGLAGLGLSGVAAKKGAKVAVCHYDADAESYVLINVSQNGWDNGHSKHENDFERGDVGGCCNDSECSHLNDGSCYFGVCDQTTGTCKQVFTGDGSCLT